MIWFKLVLKPFKTALYATKYNVTQDQYTFPKSRSSDCSSHLYVSDYEHHRPFALCSGCQDNDVFASLLQSSSFLKVRLQCGKGAFHRPPKLRSYRASCSEGMRPKACFCDSWGVKDIIGSWRIWLCQWFSYPEGMYISTISQVFACTNLHDDFFLMHRPSTLMYHWLTFAHNPNGKSERETGVQNRGWCWMGASR